jgi:hypothetical protein
LEDLKGVFYNPTTNTVEFEDAPSKPISKVKCERFQVPAGAPYQVTLSHTPIEGTLVVGYSYEGYLTEVSDPSFLGEGRYYVDYSTGVITFHSGDAGKWVDAHYKYYLDPTDPDTPANVIVAYVI